MSERGRESSSVVDDEERLAAPQASTEIAPAGQETKAAESTPAEERVTYSMSPGLALPVCRGKPLFEGADRRPVVRACQSRPGGASCRSIRVRNAPLATLGHRSATCRDVPRTDSCTAANSLSIQ